MRRRMRDRQWEWLAACGCGLALCASTWNAVEGAATAPAAALDYRERFERIAVDLGARWQSRILVDPAIRPGAPPRTPSGTESLPGALNALCASVREVSWKRVYALVEVKTEEQVEALADEARLLEGISVASLGIESPASRRWSQFQRNRPAGGSPRLQPGPRDGAETPVYLLYSRLAGEAGSEGRQLASLQRQQLETPVSEAAQSLAYAQMMQLIHALPPADREVFARRTVEASLQTWTATPGDQRQEMIRQTLGLLQHLGVGQDENSAPVGPSGPQPPPRAAVRTKPRSRLAEFKSIVRELASRHGVSVAIDRELFVAQVPRKPASELPLDQAMAALGAQLSGITWRRVYLREADRAQLETPRGAERLAADVRRLELHEGGSLELEREQRVTTYLRHRPVTARFEAEREAVGLGKQPVYVWFSTTPSARGETPEARFADLQRQQIGLMLRMSPAQMGQTMQQLIDGFGSLDSASQKRVLGLPLIAGMMAGWFPRHAKESMNQ